MPEDKVLAQEVSDITKQEETANPTPVHHTNSEHAPEEHHNHSHSEHTHANTEDEHKHSEQVHKHSEHEHKSHEHHEHRETKHHKFWDVSKSSSIEEKKGIKQFLWDNRLIIIALIAIFFLAFGIRAHLLQYHYLFEFDAFYHARLVEQIVTTGHIVSPDPQVYYQIGGSIPQQLEIYHLVSAGLYELFAFGQPYNKDLLMWVIQFFPIVFGAIISILMYFLGKEVFNNKKIGLITAFIAAVTPAFAYRTMAGAQGDNSFGFIWMVLGFIFFVRAVKSGTLKKWDIINVILAGVFCGIMVLTWNLYPLIPLVLIAYAFFAIVLVATKDEGENLRFIERQPVILAIKLIITFAIFHILATLYGADWIGATFGYVDGAVNAVLGLSLSPASIAILSFIVLVIIFSISTFFISKSKKETKSIFSIIVILALFASIIVLIGLFLTVPDLFYSHQGRTTIASLVGEESVGNSFFGTKYNALIVFPWIGLIIFPICLWFFKRKDDHTAIIFFFWVLIALVLAWYKLKFTFVLGLAIAPAAALVFYQMFEGLKRLQLEKGIETKVIFLALFFIVLLGVGASAKFFPDYVPFVDQNPQWQSAISWINTNTPNDAKFFNWWDQGHILAFLTDKKYSTDNRNYDSNANIALAEFVITSDTNKAYQIASGVNKGYNLGTEQIGADYIILDSSMFQSAPSFEYYVANKVDSSIIQKYYNGPINVLSCSDYDTNTANVTCQGNSIPRDQWNKLSDTWKSTPDDFQNGSIPVFYYRSNGDLIILNQALNNTNIAKVWLNSAETRNYYEIAYNNGTVMILKIKK